MKIAITGKGGVGKTTLASALALLYAAEGRKVLAADADPDANLGLALGFTEDEIAEITPIAKMSELIAERTGAGEGTYGRFFKINPKVDDIPDRFAAEKNGVKFLVMGTVESGGGGCVCPESVMLKRVMSNLIVQRDEVVIMDMEAGLEHLGRGTASMVDRFIVVAEPGARSVQTFGRIKELAADLGVKDVKAVGNKIRTQEDKDFILSKIPEEDILGFISYDESIITADREGGLPKNEKVIAEIEEIKSKL
jgi:CO dehydrogenase maturation factor